MELFNAMDLKNGKLAERSTMGTLIQPIQFIPRKAKTDEWKAWNIDFIEWEGLKQIRRKARRLSKNYKLANGLIDKTDYLINNDNEYEEVLDTLVEDGNAALDLKFYPIVPNVINTLCAEFAKRNTKITFTATDDQSYNEMLEQKKSQIEDVLLSDARQKFIQNLIEAGVDPDDPSIAQEMEQKMSDESLKTLPEIQDFFNKSYRGQAEEWATHQYQIDQERFGMDELEERAFRDQLITDSEFWHFEMRDDDYEVELWNPMLTAYRKSPDSRYISQGAWVCKYDMMTIQDIIDKYGWLMTEEQMKSLEQNYPIRAAGYNLTGYEPQMNYDPTRSHDWNVDAPGLAYRQFTSMWEGGGGGVDIVDWITRQGEDYQTFEGQYLLRVTTAYWKAQRKVGFLTKILLSGEPLVDIVDEDYKITDAPLYNTQLIKNKTKDNLIFGEHIDWIWINEVMGARKIGPNFPSYWGMNTTSGISPMYLGINQNRIGPLKFQFRGDRNLYGCKLPVEGAVFSDYNSRSVSLVDNMKPHQIGYNIVNNQIADILVDELGTVLAFDPRMLPKTSLGEDWGDDNYAKGFVAMKNFGVLPLNHSLENGPVGPGGEKLTVLNLEQTARLMSRIQLALYFKQQAFEVVGITPQRMGQQMGRQTATGVEENLNASYAQTEKYFINHSDHLMPRVHQMRTDLAQHYNSKNPSLRLQYITSKDEKVNFEINGTELLLRDINVFATSNALSRDMLEKLKRLAIENNTSGATIFDLGEVMMSDSIAEVNKKMKQVEAKMRADAERKHQQEMEQIQLQNEYTMKQKQMDLDWKAAQEQMNREKDIFVAKIRAAGYGAAVDVDKNGQNDFMDFLDREDTRNEFNQTMNFEQEKEQTRTSLQRDKLQLEREKLANQKEMKNVDLTIARENKNKFDKKPPAKKK